MKLKDKIQQSSASHMKLLENTRDSETSTMRKSSADVDVDDGDLEISSFLASRGMVSKNVWKT